MLDIGNMLVDIMQKNECSSVYALFALAKEKEDVSVFQSEPRRSLRGGLCAESNINADKTELGRHIH